jgi:hypothetical protein
MATAFAPGPFAKAPDADTPDHYGIPATTISRRSKSAILLEFMEELVREGVTGRIQELIAKRRPLQGDRRRRSGRQGSATWRKLARDVEQARRGHSREVQPPAAERAAQPQGQGRRLRSPSAREVTTAAQRAQPSFAQEQAAKRRGQRARRGRAPPPRRAGARAEGRTSARPSSPRPSRRAAPVAKPVARGDLGSRVGGRTVWKHEIQVPIASCRWPCSKTEGRRGGRPGHRRDGPRRPQSLDQGRPHLRDHRSVGPLNPSTHRRELTWPTKAPQSPPASATDPWVQFQEQLESAREHSRWRCRRTSRPTSSSAP